MGFCFHAVLILAIIHALLAAGAPIPDPNSTATQDHSAVGVPIWAIALVAVILLALIVALAYYILRRRGSVRTGSIDATGNVEKRTSSGSLQTLVTARPIMENKRSTTLDKEQDRHVASSGQHDEEERHPSYDPPKEKKDKEQQQPLETKISLPLPPPWTSLFADKMELNSDEAIEVLGQYMNAKSEEAEAKANRGFDLDVNQMYSNAAANIQQKAANLRSTLRQSLRRQKSTGRSHTPINRLFDDALSSSDSKKDLARQVSNASSSYSPQAAGPMTLSAKDDPYANAPTNKVMIDSIPTDASSAPAHAMTTEASYTSLTDKITAEPSSMSADESHGMPLSTRHAMRSMSKRAKTRSAAVNGSALQQMFEQQGEAAQQQPQQDQDALALPSMTPGHRGKESGYFSSVRSRDPRVLENLTISSGSVRRLVRDSIVVDGKASMSVRARRPSGPAVQEIVGWWQNEASSASPPNANLPARASTSSPTNYISSGSATISGKTQLSRFEESGRRNSTSTKQRASTLGRNTVKNTSHLNSVKALRGLFDNAGCKVAPESQKTQLTSSQIDSNKLNEAKPTTMKTVLANNERLAASTKYSLPELDNDTLETTTKKRGEVDTIRRVLQATWQSNMKESGSLVSIRADSVNDLASYAADADTSQIQPPARRASPAIERAMQQEPKPAASFSSSTAHTMIPERADAGHRTNKVAPLVTKSTTPTSTTGWGEEPYLLANSSNPTLDRRSPSSGHSRKSSGDNSTGTVLRIGTTSQTWNGRVKKQRPNVLPGRDDVDDGEHPISPTLPESLGSHQKKKYFSTMRKGSRQQRSGLPMWPADDEKTPAQLERDRYLGSHHDDDEASQRAQDEDYDSFSQRSSWATVRPIQ